MLRFFRSLRSTGVKAGKGRRGREVVTNLLPIDLTQLKITLKHIYNQFIPVTYNVG